MATVEEIINRSIALGDSKSAQAEAYGGQAVTLATGSVVINPAKITNTPKVKEPIVYIPSRAAGVDFTIFDAKYQQIIDDLSYKFASFLTEYFPLNAGLMNAVEDWLEKAITSGGTGINATVEQRIWQRSRDRITADASAAIDEAMALWASRGFPLPPGAANSSVAAIQRKRSAEVAAVSRDAAIKAFETEIENVRFAVTTAIEYRTKAVSAAGDFIRALAVAPSIASQLSTNAAGAQERLISAAASLYNARINEAEMIQRYNITQSDMTLKSLVDSATLNRQYVEVKSKAAADVAQSLGMQASAALNAVNATVQKIVSE